MPRTKLQEMFSNQAPPIDWLKAAILERQDALGYNLKDLAAVGGISYDHMRRLIHVSPWDWPKAVRERVCKALGVKPLQGVEGMPS